MSERRKNHPNRSTWPDEPVPTPDEIRAVRERAELTQEAAAKLVGMRSQTRWSEYETGTRRPAWTTWQLFLLRVDQHPEYRLARRRAPAEADLTNTARPRVRPGSAG
jgi:DNA-binding XRE family transcriptional regulator